MNDDDKSLIDRLTEEGEREDREKGVSETWVRLDEIVSKMCETSQAVDKGRVDEDLI